MHFIEELHKLQALRSLSFNFNLPSVFQLNHSDLLNEVNLFLENVRHDELHFLCKKFAHRSTPLEKKHTHRINVQPND